MYKYELYTALGISIISWSIFALVILKRYPYSIDENVKWITLGIVVGIIVWNLLQIRNISRQLLRKEASNFQKYITKLVEKIYYL